MLHALSASDAHFTTAQIGSIDAVLTRTFEFGTLGFVTNCNSSVLCLNILLVFFKFQSIQNSKH